MVILGAGASYDSVGGDSKRDYRPPLTGELFTDPSKLEKYLFGRGSAKGLVSDITSQLERGKQAEGGFSVEEALTREYAATSGNPVLHRAFTALRYYLRDLFRDSTREWPRQVGGATNYTWLVRAIEKWRSVSERPGYVLWVTFNYDGLLDQALMDLYDYDLGGGGVADPQLRTFLEHPDWALLKLHGSYDWRRATNLSLPEPLGTGDADATYRELERSWTAGDDPPTLQTVYERARDGTWPSDASGDRRLWIPSVMTPLSSKASFECPPTHVELLDQRVARVDAILTIGWKAQEFHFLGKLAVARLNPPDILSVTTGPTSSAGVAERIRAATGPVAADGDMERAAGDSRTGFNDLRVKSSDFGADLSGRVEAARDRRHAREDELKRLD